MASRVSYAFDEDEHGLGLFVFTMAAVKNHITCSEAYSDEGLKW